MSIRTIHLLDASTCEDAARLCSLLLARLPASEVSQQVVTMGALPAGLILPEHVRRIPTSRPMVWPFLAALPLQRRLARERPDVIVAWSAIACAAAASSWTARRPLLGVVCDPADARESARWRSAACDAATGGFELICTSGTAQRRLVESGVPAEAVAVIRPGVDFAELRRARENVDRSRLNLAADARVLLTMSPPSRAGGQYYAAWATAILHHIWPEAVLIVPGTSREASRIGRLIDGIYCPQAFRLTADQFTPAQLLALADALLVPAIDDLPTAYLAWAMAAGVPIIGSAIPAVAEYLADRHNGFLCKPGEPHTLAIRIRTAFESPDTLASCVQSARHQAYETFRAERCVEEFLRAIRNLAEGRPSREGLRDAAIG